MEERASAIIISKRHLLLIHRVRADRDYYVFPGGRVEDGENAEEACRRELLEETGLSPAWLEHAFEHPLPTRNAQYFFVQVHPGTPTLGGPEVLKQSAQNRYIHEWVPLTRVSEINLQPLAVRNALAKIAAQNGPIHEARDLAVHRETIKQILREDQPVN